MVAALRIRRSYAVLRTGDRLNVHTIGLFGDRALDFVPGPQSAPLVGEGDTLAAVIGPPTRRDLLTEEFRKELRRDSGA